MGAARDPAKSGGGGLIDRPQQLTDLQIDVAAVFFSLDISGDYLVAGGAALLASDLISRPTHDLDLFASRPTMAVTPALHALVEALEHRGLQVEVVQRGETFCRLIVRRGRERTLVDLAIDSPPSMDPTITVLGPTLASEELAGRKLLALFSRAEARDFADVYVLAQRFGKGALIKQAGELDAGFDLGVLAQMMRTLARFTEDEIPLPSGDVEQAREFFARWSHELAG